MPAQALLPAFYRLAMRLTKRRGSHTLGRWNARLFPDGQVVRLAPNCDFYVPADPHFFGYILGHEPHIARTITDLIEPGDTCVDVGANIGYFTVMMASRCGPTGRVVAYEPDAANFASLGRNVGIARRRGLAVEAVKAAVSDRDGSVELVRGRESTLHQVRAAAPGAPSANMVASVSLGADLAARSVIGPIKLLKIDVEGHEPAVLRGCRSLLAARRIENAVIEVNAGDHASEVAEILDEVGATARCWIDGAWRQVPVAAVPRRTDVLARFR